MEGLGNRLRAARIALGYAQKGIADAVGCGLRSWQDYEAEAKVPGSQVIAGLARLGVDAHWILTGEGEMMRNARGHSGPRADLEADYAIVPLYDVRAAAGHGSVVHSEQVIDYLAFRRDWLWRELHATEADLYLIEVDGESMEPTLRAGDVILVDRRSAQDVPRDGIYVLRMDGTLLCKRLQRLPGGRLRVSSDHPAYEPYELRPDEVHDLAIVGRVVWSGRRM